MNALIPASLLAPDNTRNGSTDTWGNIKILASHYVSGLEPGAWRAIDVSSELTNFSSLIGVPIWGVLDKGNANFTLVWPIFDITDCNWTASGYTVPAWCDVPRPNWYSVTINATECITSTAQGGTSDSSYEHLSVMSSDDYSTTQLNTTSTPQYMKISFSVRNPHKLNNITYLASKLQCVL